MFDLDAKIVWFLRPCNNIFLYKMAMENDGTCDHSDGSYDIMISILDKNRMLLPFAYLFYR